MSKKINVEENGFYLNTDAYEKSGENEILIRFQSGISKDIVRNGIDIEDLIELALIRLKHYNSILPCRENSLVITKLQESLFWLSERRKDREERRNKVKNN